MGGVVSTGKNNDHLVDNLIEADYIKSPMVERVFRAVDRAEYFLPGARNNAYRDLAWRNGNLHISAPCIYSEVMEGLCLKPGLSFLNLGSGTGYLSTMVGLILGYYGVNHGIEYHSDVLRFAKKKLLDFKMHSGAIDEFDFCEPTFIQGNCLCLTTDYDAQYDRVYCGAACPRQYESYMKNLLKVGGILVMPLNDKLLQITRISNTEWDVRSLLPVSFAPLIEPLEEDPVEWVQKIEIPPRTLQSISRAAVRDMLREIIQIPLMKTRSTVHKPVKKRNNLRRLVVPLFDSEESSDDEHFVCVGGHNRRPNREESPIDPREDGLVNLFVGPFRQRRHHVIEDQNKRIRMVVRQPQERRRNDNREDNDDDKMEAEAIDLPEKKAEVKGKETRVETQAVIEHNPSTSREGSSQTGNQPEGDKNSNATEANITEEDSDALNEINGYVDVLNLMCKEREEADQQKADAGESSNANQKKREKVDSGLGDEIENQDPSDEDDENDKSCKSKADYTSEEFSSSSSSEDEFQERRQKRSSKTESGAYSTHKCRRMESGAQRFAVSGSGNDNALEDELLMYHTPFTQAMRTCIQNLPVPIILKKYLNYYREF